MEKTILVLALIVGLAAASVAQLPYEGRVLSVATGFDGIASILTSRTSEFKNLTGATVIITQRGFDSLFDDMFTDLEQGSPFFDAFVFAPQWLSDFVDCRSCQQGKTLLTSLSDYVKVDPDINWLDVAVFFRQFSAVYDGKIYAIPLDGDVHYLHVRKDVLDRLNLPVPETWDEFLSVASQIHGLDYNNDSIPDSAICIGMKKSQQAYWWPWTVYGSYIQSRGTDQGAFFDLNTMEPLVNNDGFTEALSIYKRFMEFSPSNVLNIDITVTREMFRNGSCAMTLDWANPFSFMVQTPYRDGYLVSTTPGTHRVVDRATGLLVNCTAEICPFATLGRNGRLINKAPYAAFGGWSGSISALIPPVKQQLAYDFLSFLGRPSTSSKDVTLGLGFDLYRYSHLNVSNWEAAGFPPSYVNRMLNTFRSVLSSPNLVIDLRIHGTSRYQQVILDALVYNYVSGQISIVDLKRGITDGWNNVTNSFGRNNQLVSYRATIGSPKIIPCDSSAWNFSVSDCDLGDEILVSFAWNEPKVCQAGLDLPKSFRAGKCAYVVLGSPIGLGVTIASTVMIAVFLLLAALVFRQRDEPIIRRSSWVFSIIIIFGGAVMNTFILSSVGPPDMGTCVINIWLLSLGFSLLFGGFLAKMYRIERLLNTPISVKVVKISDIQLAKILGAIILVDIALLCTWTWLSPVPDVVSVNVTVNSEILGKQRVCSGGNNIGMALLFTYKVIMLVYGGFLAARIRHAPAEFSEQRFVTTSIVVVGFSGVVILPLIYTIDSNRVLISALGVLFVTASSIGIYTIPKLVESFGFARFGFRTPSDTHTMTSRSSPRVHVGARSLPLQSSMQSNEYLIECPECGHKFEI